MAWFQAPVFDDEGQVEWECPEDLGDKKLHVVRKVIGFDVDENGKEFFLIDWAPTWEKASNLSLKMIAASKAQRRMLVERTYIEAQATEAGKKKRRVA